MIKNRNIIKTILKIERKEDIIMTEILTTVAYVSSGIALGVLVEYPLYSAFTNTREKYSNWIKLSKSEY